MARTLSPDELRWAVEHAAKVHRLAQAQRDLAARVTSLDELRRALLESGMPAADVDAAIASLETALATRRRRVRLGLGIGLGLGLGLAAAAGVLLTAAPAGAPRAFVNLRHQIPGRAAFSSWEGGGSLDGEAERALAEALRAAGIETIASLEEKNLRRLFVGASAQPTRAALRAATAASVALLGDARCTQIGGEPVDGPKTVRSALRLEALRVDSGLELGRGEAEGVATDPDLGRACAQAAARAMGDVAGRLVPEVAARFGLAPAP